MQPTTPGYCQAAGIVVARVRFCDTADFHLGRFADDPTSLRLILSLNLRKLHRAVNVPSLFLARRQPLNAAYDNLLRQLLLQLRENNVLHIDNWDQEPL
jgi:hypothetical protein